MTSDLSKPGRNIILAAVICSALAGLGVWKIAVERSYRELPALSLAHTEEGGFTLKVDGKPYFVRGVCYNPIPIGEGHGYDFWSDPGKPWLTDGKLMKDMGVNTVRFYQPGERSGAVKKVIHDLYRKFDIRSMMGHHLGFWDWPPANYGDARFRAGIREKVLDMVRTYREEPGIIAWILGNENNYSFDQNVRPWTNEELSRVIDPQERREAMAKIYYGFINELALEVKKMDPVRPVVMGMGEVKSIHEAREYAPDIDILGIIAYRGATFGNLWRQVRQAYNKPVLMIEYGADGYNAYTREPDEDNQGRFVQLQSKDIKRNSTLRTPKGNAIGGFIFEWTDEWWKANEGLAHTWGVHDRTAQWSHSAYYYDYEAPGHQNINEEWWGIVGLKAKPDHLEKGLDKRLPKKAYHLMKEAWTK